MCVCAFRAWYCSPQMPNLESRRYHRGECSTISPSPPAPPTRRSLSYLACPVTSYVPMPHEAAWRWRLQCLAWNRHSVAWQRFGPKAGCQRLCGATRARVQRCGEAASRGYAVVPSRSDRARACDRTCAASCAGGCCGQQLSRRRGVAATSAVCTARLGGSVAGSPKASVCGP